MLNSDQIFELLDDSRSFPCADDDCTDRLIVMTTEQAHDIRKFLMWLLEEGDTVREVP